MLLEPLGVEAFGSRAVSRSNVEFGATDTLVRCLVKMMLVESPRGACRFDCRFYSSVFRPTAKETTQQ